ncbi:hypothetical protein QE357_000354 [Siphonobacter sp. BAB-5404]|nr:hypothetical protein [Siphonobacter sp. SORGH_AS_0500]
MEEIENNEFNLNIYHYMSTSVEVKKMTYET